MLARRHRWSVRRASRLDGAKASTVAATYDYQDALAVIAQLTGDFRNITRKMWKPDFE